jgi:tRNA 2-thiocytidine biosynthesis protein TtcA
LHLTIYGKRMAYLEKEIRSLVGKAIHRYGLIQEGDRILVGVSGGKDSLTLLHLLKERLKRVPIKYELTAVHIDLGFGSERAEGLRNYFEGQGLSYHIEFTDIGKRANSPENRENPCFLCAWERRKKLFQLTRQFQCNKVALGHHKDDILETLLINIFYSGEISTMLPLQSLFNGKITIIRPLSLAEERKIERFAQAMRLPFGSSGCPSTGKTKRKEVKEIIEFLSKRNRKVKGNIFRALSNIRLDYLLPPSPRSRKTGNLVCKAMDP